MLKSVITFLLLLFLVISVQAQKLSTHLPVAEYTALQMKQAVVGYGKAQKAQVQEMVRRMLQLPGLPGTDAADALGLAITHAHAGRSLQMRAAALAADGARGRGLPAPRRR